MCTSKYLFKNLWQFWSCLLASIGVAAKTKKIRETHEAVGFLKYGRSKGHEESIYEMVGCMENSVNDLQAEQKEGGGIDIWIRAKQGTVGSMLAKHLDPRRAGDLGMFVRVQLHGNGTVAECSVECREGAADSTTESRKAIVVKSRSVIVRFMWALTGGIMPAPSKLKEGKGQAWTDADVIEVLNVAGGLMHIKDNSVIGDGMRTTSLADALTSTDLLRKNCAAVSVRMAWVEQASELGALRAYMKNTRKGELAASLPPANVSQQLMAVVGDVLRKCPLVGLANLLPIELRSASGLGVLCLFGSLIRACMDQFNSQECI